MEKYGDGINLYTAEEYLKMPDPVIAWRCVGIVPQGGTTLIVAPPKTLKTTYSIELALDMAKGKPHFNYPCEKSVVLYVCLERHTDFKRKLRQITGGNIPANFHVFEYKSQLALDRGGDNSKAILQKAISEIKADVVFIDSKYNTTTYDESNQEATSYWMKNINNIRRETGCAFVILHHVPKSVYFDLVNRPAGSSLLSRWTDVIVGIKRVGNAPRRDPRRIIEFVSNSGDEPDDIEVKVTATGLEDMGSHFQETKTGEAMLILQKDIEANPLVSISARIDNLVEKTDIGNRTFWHAWNTLKNE